MPMIDLERIFSSSLNTLFVFLMVETLFICVALSFYYVGTKARFSQKINPSDMIPSFILGLLSLILAFTFSVVIERYEERRHLTIKESAAIGTAYIRSSLLPKIPQHDINELFKEYVDLRVKFYEVPYSSDEGRKILGQCEVIKDKMWKHLRLVSKKDAGALTSAYVYAFTEMFDVEEERNFAINRNIPFTIYYLILIIGCVAISSLYFDRGYNNEKVHWRPNLFIVVLSIMVTFVYDMDHPNQGVLKIGQEAMLEVQKQIHNASLIEQI